MIKRHIPHPIFHNSLLALCLMVFAASATAADWPQWRGPERSAVSKESGLLQDWPNFPGMKGSNWTYGAMYLYHGHAPEGDSHPYEY